VRRRKKIEEWEKEEREKSEKKKKEREDIWRIISYAYIIGIIFSSYFSLIMSRMFSSFFYIFTNYVVRHHCQMAN